MLTATPPTLRVGMISLTDPDDPDQLSGMPHRMAVALRAQGVRIVPVFAAQSPAGASTRLRTRIARVHKRRSPDRLKRLVDALFPGAVRENFLDRARSMSARIDAGIAALDEPVDLLFGVCIAAALYDLHTTLPIVYFSDATSRIIDRSYPRFAARGRAFHDAREHLERTALSRVTRAAFAAPRTRDSAVNDFGVPPDRASVIPMGAHITPADRSSIRSPAQPPTVRDCRLLIVAADPVRKRVDLAVRAAEQLRLSGVNATLFVVGPGTPLSRSSAAVESVGPLRLSNPGDAQRHRELLASCHIQLLPSLGEAFGIAPAESAHFARPSIVTDAGGLPFVVLDGQTGLVLPVNADHRAWTHTIATLVQEPRRYQRYSTAALARARDELNWSAWATGIIALMNEALEERRAGVERAG